MRLAVPVTIYGADGVALTSTMIEAEVTSMSGAEMPKWSRVRFKARRQGYRWGKKKGLRRARRRLDRAIEQTEDRE